MSSKAAELYKRYVTAFAAIPDGERREILESVVEAHVVYRTPTMEGAGVEIILADIHLFQSRFPQGRFILHSISEHHDVALMEWQLVLADDTLGVRGHDAVLITREGKFGQITTFAPSTLEAHFS